MGAKLAEMKAQGCERILVAPLYPQYSGATTATVVDAMGAALAAMRWQPAIRTLPPYYDDAAHIEADEMRREMTSLQQSDLKRRSSNQLMNPVEKEEEARRLGYVKPDELPLKSQKAENNAPDGQ